MADLGPGETPTADQIAAGAAPVPFWGHGRIDIKFDDSMILPDGLMLPMTTRSVVGSYQEGTLQ